MVNPERIHIINKGTETNGPVVYWMSRDQRVHDNWALLFAQQLANEKHRHLAVVFNLVPDFLEAGFRQYSFMIKGLQEVENECRRLNIPFMLLTGNPVETISAFLKKINASELITDFDPLKIKQLWKAGISKKINIPFYEVDAHNIIPVRYVSQKQEFAAYTIRPKILKNLPEFLEEFPLVVKREKTEALAFDPTDWQKVFSSLKVNRQVKESALFIPGAKAAFDMLNDFLNNRLEKYNTERNDPNADAQSGLSPYLHFGQISAQRIALNTKIFGGDKESEAAFLEELIVRRELADNFCLYNQHYDSFEGFHTWAKETLEKHLADERKEIYTAEQFEKALTHEDLWNAAQTELVTTGKLHGYMRMYWAKKILEWSKSPAEALQTAIYLNDKYSLDGRDPNGYTGCAWSIGGIHDRAWFERPIFGKIRYMNRNGAKSKFDINSYIKKFTSAAEPSLF
jgi:deoxyribodipyrimidine photo-lyase